MFPAIGAASLALDAIQSLTSPQGASSQAAGGFGPALSDAADGSPTSSAASSSVAGFGNSQLSPNNISALIDAQSLASANFVSALDSGSQTSDPSQGHSASASSAYSTINQLTQSAAVPLGLSPVSISA